MEIDLQQLAFVDVETTGVDPAIDRIAEIGVVILSGDATSEWSTFVTTRRGADPRAPRAGVHSLGTVPISAPTFRDIAASLKQRLAGRLLVAHNARFDYAFLKAEFERAGIDFDAPVLCTMMLSRRLYRQHAAHDLDALMRRHDLVIGERHRALPDARMLSACWQAMQRENGRAVIAEVVAELLAGPVLPAKLDPALIDRLPDGPGVYVLRGADDEILRIGEATNLRRRVTDYFRLDRASPRALAIAHRIEKITWAVTQGMLGARLQRIACENLNAKRRKTRASGLLSWRGSPEREPSLELVAIGEAALTAGSELFGAFDTERKARNALVRMARQHALCHGVLGIPRSGRMRCPACDGDGTACGEKMQRLRRLVECFVALRPLRLMPWPYPGPIVVRERRDLHVFNEWRHLATVKTQSEARDAMESRAGEFDISVYALLVRALPKIKPDRLFSRVDPTAREALDYPAVEPHLPAARAKEKGRHAMSAFEDFGGDEEDRTPDLRIANAALSQLSYVPNATKYS